MVGIKPKNTNEMNFDELSGDPESIVGRARKVIILFGEPVGTEQLPDESPAVDSICNNCGSPVQSTIKKQVILTIAQERNKPAVLLCENCIGPAISHRDG